MKAFVRLIRPKQWTKNTLVFAAIIFARHYTNPSDWILAALTFVSFCMVASGIYIINDIFDIEADRRHPTKCKRPIAAGEIGIGHAVFFAMLLLISGILLGWYVRLDVAIILAGYAVVMVLYSYVLKHQLLLDVFIIACGLTSRAVIGARAIDVDISHWLLVCTFFIALTLAMAKRRQELHRIKEDRSLGRKSLKHSPPVRIWDIWISTMSGITILAYTLYTLDPVTAEKAGSANLIFTVPFVVYALLRYQYLVFTSRLGEDPTEVLLGDRGILLSLLGWLIVVLLVLTL